MLSLLGEHLNLNYLSPYLDSLAQNFTSGVNFAVTGAMTLPQFIPFALDVQVRQFIRFKNRSIELQTTGKLIYITTPLIQLECGINKFCLKLISGA